MKILEDFNTFYNQQIEPCNLAVDRLQVMGIYHEGAASTCERYNEVYRKLVEAMANKTGVDGISPVLDELLAITKDVNALTDVMEIQAAAY